MLACALLLSVLQQVVVPCKPGARQPQLSVGTDGHVALAWAAKGELYCCYGEPGDQQNFLRVHHMYEKLRYSVGLRRGPRVALLDGDHVVLTAIGGEKGGGNDGDVWAWRNAPEKLAWHKALRINSVAGSAREGLHALARSAQGEVYCAWIDLRSGKPQVFGALSKDAGKSWENEGPVSREVEICPCCAPSVAFDGQGSVCVMWRGVSEGARDMQLARSANGGKAFDAASKLGTGTWKLDACPMDGGALAVSADGKLSAVWRRERSVFSASDASSETLIGTGEQPWIAGGALAWLEKRGSKLLVLLPGAQEPQTLDSSANDPVLAARPDGKGALYAAWETGEGDATQIRLERLAPR
jgi:hypothetical protein